MKDFLLLLLYTAFLLFLIVFGSPVFSHETGAPHSHQKSSVQK